MDKAIYIVNAVLLLLIARYEYTSDSDKTVIISGLTFAVLFSANPLLGLFAQLDKKPISRHFYYSALGLFAGVMILMWLW